MIPRTETWPADRLYWAVIDAPQWRRAGPLPPGLQDQAEEVLPMPISELHAVCVPAESGRLLVCGAVRTDLDGVPADVFAVTPETIPECLGVNAPTDGLNLLTGEFEPRAVGRARTKAHLAAMAALVLMTALVITGLQRRAGAWERAANATGEAASALLKQHAPGQTSDQLAFDVQRRRSEASEASVLRSPEEASPALVRVLQSWPAEYSAKPLSLNVTPRTAAVSLVVQGDASRFIESFKAPEGWSLDEPRLYTAGDTTRVNLQLHQNREEASK